MWQINLQSVFREQTLAFYIGLAAVPSLRRVRHQDGQLHNLTKPRRSDSRIDRKNLGYERKHSGARQLEVVAARVVRARPARARGQTKCKDNTQAAARNISQGYDVQNF